MKKLGFALVGVASLALAGCGSNSDNLNNVTNLDNASNLDALSNDAANDAEAEALGNQAAQLNQEGNAAATDELNASGNSSADENVAGM